ncbi:MAG: hypothetical protein KAR40_12295 [Candidatus Sabulitectum sp.]|nr:hypothetical protein [Candidatus Sabulitectum sp.]
MKLLAFYAAALLMLCVMVFGGIEGFSFKLRMETGEFLSDAAGFNTEQFSPEAKLEANQTRSCHIGIKGNDKT